MRRGAFSFVEVLVGAFFLGLVLVGMMALTSFANRSSLDARYELLAYQVAREPIEIFRELGHAWLRRQYLEGGKPLPLFPPGSADLAVLDPEGRKYPGEAQAFLREIAVERAMTGEALRVTVRVGPRPKTRAEAWWHGGRTVELRALIFPTSVP